jgi:glucose/arabinose dehydrogenase
LASCVNNPEPEFDSEKIHSTVELVKDTMFNEDRFSKIELATGNLNEPLEMAILPNLDILIIQRKGEIVLFDSKFKKLETVGKLETYCENRDFPFPYKSEEGLLGLTIDPDFKNNNFIYLFYSVKDSLLHRLSRFVFKNRKLENASEKVILEFYAERKVENHTGGSLTFGNDRILFLSTGDNSTQADQKNSLYKLSGYAPIDDRVGFKNHDARRTSSNTFDLRGKIIRIKINEDCSYSIP